MPGIELLLSNRMSILRNQQPSRRLFLRMNLKYRAITGYKFKRPNLNRSRHQEEKVIQYLI